MGKRISKSPLNSEIARLTEELLTATGQNEVVHCRAGLIGRFALINRATHHPSGINEQRFLYGIKPYISSGGVYEAVGYRYLVDGTMTHSGNLLFERFDPEAGITDEVIASVPLVGVRDSKLQKIELALLLSQGQRII